MSQRVRCSILVPAFNAGPTLARALDSALEQGGEDIEVIVLDDASTDDTPRVAADYARREPRVRVYTAPQNSGKPVVMNEGIARARGAWIAVLDADDAFAPGRIAQLLDEAEAAGCDLVADNMAYVDEVAGAVSKHAFPPTDPAKQLDLTEFLLNSNPFLEFDYGILKPVVRADFLRRHQIVYEPRARRGQDWYFLLETFAAGARGLLLPSPGYLYTQPLGSISRRPASGARAPYPYPQYIEVNKLYEARYWGRLAPSEHALLVKRRLKLEALVRLHELKAALAAKRLSQAARMALGADLAFSELVAQRVARRFAQPPLEATGARITSAESARDGSPAALD